MDDGIVDIVPTILNMSIAPNLAQSLILTLVYHSLHISSKAPAVAADHMRVRLAILAIRELGGIPPYARFVAAGSVWLRTACVAAAVFARWTQLLDGADESAGVVSIGAALCGLAGNLWDFAVLGNGGTDGGCQEESSEETAQRGLGEHGECGEVFVAEELTMIAPAGYSSGLQGSYRSLY